jgi:CheY-like chemotaxis protein
MATVLLVDDSALVREKVRRLFEQSYIGWNVAEAVDGRDGVEKVEALKPDLVVLDFAMPIMNGLEAAAMIKRISPRLPMILLTAHASDILQKEAFEKGISVIVSKTEAANRLVDSARILLQYGAKNKTTSASATKVQV